MRRRSEQTSPLSVAVYSLKSPLDPLGVNKSQCWRKRLAKILSLTSSRHSVNNESSGVVFCAKHGLVFHAPWVTNCIAIYFFCLSLLSRINMTLLASPADVSARPSNWPDSPRCLRVQCLGWPQAAATLYQHIVFIWSGNQIYSFLKIEATVFLVFSRTH